MGLSEILEFVKVEHTLFSLPFVLIGFVLADKEFGSESLDIVWILIAAVGARGLAMALNRIVDREIDAENPRTATRHLPAGTMSTQSAWILATIFLSMLLLAAWNLNHVALKMAWLPVLAFAIYPYTKRFSWICHFWIGLCLALAPAGAWVAVASDTHGWAAITGSMGGGRDYLWFPELFFISLGVAFWITAFDLNYALMDVEVDRDQGINSFPATHGRSATMKLSVLLTLGWSTSFLISGVGDQILWFTVVVLMALVNLYIMTLGASNAQSSVQDMEIFQRDLFRGSMLTGWFLLGSLGLMVY